MSEMQGPEKIYAAEKRNSLFGNWFFCEPSDIPTDTYHHDRIVQAKDARIAELEAQLKERDGYVLVPVEPTEEMKDAGQHWIRQHGNMSQHIWKEMIAARPNASTEGV